ncbi:MAG: phenylalanine--tRNA ligase subunit beta [Actinomycetota bacterium]|nr:phenylalanine--tRNA ligase subunit beta [Actinomycetota bacterium]
MRVPLRWLREYVDFDLRVDELVEVISLHSQEVDGVEQLGVLDGEVVVGEVKEFGPHPNADRLFVAKVDLDGQLVQIVAGAPNPYPGARVPVVLPGSVMADGRKLKKAKLRGLESYGMMMSERELGISPDHGGILLLDDSYAVGRPVLEYFPVSETVLDIDVTPNRPDLWGMLGVARELAAILQTDFRVPEPSFETGGEPTAAYTLRVGADDLCPRYDLRRVSNLTPGRRAPLEMRRRIYAAGMRPINAVVDATNYVMLETGQPIHAFDARLVREGIVVRRARPEEKITLLDGTTRVLDEEMLVIADEERGLVIAGVMGAEDAEVGDETEDALIEVATFAGRNILETSQRLGLRTDASGRYERGLDPNMVDYAMDRVTGLLVEHPGGSAAPDTLSHYPDPVEPWRVPLRLERAELLLGMPVEADEAQQRLQSLGCQVQREDGRLSATVPTFRRDLGREDDLVEEVGRLVGLDKVPESLPAVSQPGGLTEVQRKFRVLRRVLADLGLAEALTYPFGPERWIEDLGLDSETRRNVVRVKNPLSAEGSFLRTTILPGLLDAAARNRAFGARGGGLFEVGHVFEEESATGELREAALRFRMTGEVAGVDEISGLMGVREEARVGVLLAGTVRPAGWNAPELRAGFFEAKGIVERLVPGASFEPGVRPFVHPGRSAVVRVDGAEAGWVGEVHPEVADRFGLDGWQVAGFELDPALCDPDPTPTFEAFVNVPAVHRDLALVVEGRVPVGEVLASIEALRSPILVQTGVFDVYEGPQVPEGHKSVALSFSFQGETTLTDEEVDAEIGRIAARLEAEFGARIRS